MSLNWVQEPKQKAERHQHSQAKGFAILSTLPVCWEVRSSSSHTNMRMVPFLLKWGSASGLVFLACGLVRLFPFIPVGGYIEPGACTFCAVTNFWAARRRLNRGPFLTQQTLVFPIRTIEEYNNLPQAGLITIYWTNFHGIYVTSTNVFNCVCFFIIQQDYMKATQHFTTKLGGRMWYGSGENSLSIVVDLDRGAGPGIFTFFNI